jgi:hypothetical protein
MSLSPSGVRSLAGHWGTNDRPGCKSPGCPAAVFAAVGTIWGVSKLGGGNIKEYLQPREIDSREVVIRGTYAGSRPITLSGEGR